MSATPPCEGPSLKRKRAVPSSDSEQSKEEYECPKSDANINKRAMIDKDKNSDPLDHDTGKFVILHKVMCPRSITAHVDHPEIAFFLDIPSLNSGDSKASPLRGRHKITSLQSYLEDFPHISFVIERTYNCIEFHQELEKAGKFRRIDIGPTSDEVVTQLRPYLFVLEDGAKKPEPTLETMSFPGSRFLEDTLKSCLPKGSVDRDTLVAPYLQFYHARKTIKSLQQCLTPERKAEMQALYSYIDERFGVEYGEADDLFAQGLFTMDHFQKLFGPGDVLVKTSKSEPVAFLAKRILKRQGSAITIECETWSFDGVFKRLEQIIRICVPSQLQADGKIPITSLDVSPLQFNPSSLRDRLQNRGEIFWKCRRPGLVSYQSPMKGFDIQVTNPRCMIDMVTYNELYGEPDGQSEGRDDESQIPIMTREEPPPGPFLMLLPPIIKAFRFHDKKWKSLAVECIKPVSWNKTAFERLVLKQDKKDLIEALVAQQLEVGETADVIEGKGNGLVILLHGGPGTGKTFTAEGVAEIAERPLYRLTCGDIGTEPEIVEKSLEHIFYLGSIWKAVVVLDEAEVFLEERTQADIQRNALVSVFLRALEYYNGILILTTNRVGTFDEAFKSRIHLALHYPPLGSDDRWKIWSNFIQALKEENIEENGLKINHEELRRKVDAFARHKLNGRQIRNSVRTAKQLAKFKGEVMSSIHIEKTIDVLKDFEKYIVDTHGHTDADWVESGGIRIDKTED